MIERQKHIMMRHEALIERYADLYGEYCLPNFLLRHNYIAFLWQSLCLMRKEISRSELGFYVEKIEILKKQIEEHYKLGSSASSSEHIRQVQIEFRREKIDCHSFDSELYVHNYNYARHDVKIQSGIFQLNSAKARRLDFVREAQWYLYAINRHGTVIVHTESYPLAQRIKFANNVPNRRVTHPMLVENYDLLVICAGEVLFTKSSQRIIGIVLNNRSGHFLPSRQHLDCGAEIFAKLMAIPQENILKLPL